MSDQSEQTELLEAVNMMLAGVGEQPVASAQELTDSGITSVVMAQQQLKRTSRIEQMNGWEFNTEENVELTRDSDGRVSRQNDILHVTAMDPSVVLVLRNGYYFDKVSNTNRLPEELKFRVIRHIPWEDLMEPARIYFSIRATRIFQRRFVGDESMERMSADEERYALTMLRCADADLAQHVLGRIPSFRV